MPRAGRGIAAFLAGLALAGCGGARGPTGHERLTVGPSPSLIDQPVRVTISGLPPHGTATLRTSWRSYLGTVWRSAQRVRAGGDGRATVSGTRALTTMTARGSGLFFPLGLASTARLELDEGGRAVARAALRRWTVAPSVRVRRLSMRRDGIYGVLMLPRVHR